MSNNEDSTYRGPTIPEPLGAGLRVALDLDQRPRDFGEYVDAMASIVEREGLDVDLATLCTTDESPHRATFRGRTQCYHCTLDALTVPFLGEDVGRVDIKTVSPLGGEEITFAVTHSTIESDPPEAVLSFGIGTDVQPPPTEAESPALAYRRVCPYGEAFVSEAEYERWAAQADAHTMLLTMEDGLALARALGSVA